MNFSFLARNSTRELSAHAKPCPGDSSLQDMMHIVAVAGRVATATSVPGYIYRHGWLFSWSGSVLMALTRFRSLFVTLALGMSSDAGARGCRAQTHRRSHRGRPAALGVSTFAENRSAEGSVISAWVSRPIDAWMWRAARPRRRSASRRAPAKPPDADSPGDV